METAMHFYRIAHEAVINARRHADPDRLQVRLGRTNGQLVMSIRDDGSGKPEARCRAWGSARCAIEQT